MAKQKASFEEIFAKFERQRLAQAEVKAARQQTQTTTSDNTATDAGPVRERGWPIRPQPEPER